MSEETVTTQNTSDDRPTFASVISDLKGIKSRGKVDLSIGGFIKSFAESVIIGPLLKKAQKLREYFESVNAAHDDNINVPVNTKTRIGDDFSTLYDKVGDSKDCDVGNGNTVSVLTSACDYNTEMYELKAYSASDYNKGFSDKFMVEYEMALMTKKYAYELNNSDETAAISSFYDMYRNTDDYKTAYYAYFNNPENAANYAVADVDVMKSDFEKDYFARKSADESFIEERSGYVSNYKNNLVQEYYDKMTQYKAYCNKNNIPWETVLNDVSSEFQTESVRFSEAESKVFSASGISKERILANNSFAMVKSVIESEGYDVRYNTWIRAQGDDVLNNYEDGKSILDKLGMKIGSTVESVGDFVKESPLNIFGTKTSDDKNDKDDKDKNDKNNESDKGTGSKDADDDLGEESDDRSAEISC